MLSLLPNTARVLYRETALGLPFREDSTHGHYFCGFVCREEERVHLADVIMQLRKVVTALSFCVGKRMHVCTGV